MVYTTRFAGGRGGRNHLEHELRRLGIVQKNSRPNHPTTCGKVERFQQTLKKWLVAQPDPAGHHRRPAGPPRRLRSRLQPRPPAPLAAAPGHPRDRLHRTPQSTPPAVTARPTPTTASAPTASTPPAASPCGSTAGSTTSASAEPTPEPTSCSSSRTCTSASSTPPPANSSANSSSTPPATTSPPADHPAQPQKALARTHESWVRAMPMSCDITWRWRWDLNPRRGLPSHAFEACSFGRSDTPPPERLQAPLSAEERT